jgi:hypothetical protein
MTRFRPDEPGRPRGSRRARDSTRFAGVTAGVDALTALLA